MSASVVIVGPVEALPAIRDRFDSGVELHVFPDSDALEALDHIIRHKPRIVAIERFFAATARGVAFITRLQADASLSDCELRVIAREAAQDGGDDVRVVASAVPAREHPPTLDRHGTRRAVRSVMAEGVDVLVDGNPAVLVDLSVLGAQVVSTKVLKPNQRVRVTLSDARGIIRCGGAIMWAAFELPKDLPPRYRAGIEFKSPEIPLLAGFLDRHAADRAPAARDTPTPRP